MLSACMELIDSLPLREEFEKFYRANRLRGMRTAFNILRDEALAEDALSESFLKLAECFQKIHNLPSHKLQAYFVITVRNTSLNMLRREKLIDITNYDDERDYGDLPEADFERLESCIGRLSDTDREILYLRFDLELGYGEIAAALGVTEAAARQRLRYAKNKLRALLEEGEQ
ncbi:MAG: sigma-70 family RNA polymerase sigma factor [Ruminococcus sp.]|nr:sigma-70 family RNA polymerase sigma factor [Ruminococcus sp.]